MDDRRKYQRWQCSIPCRCETEESVLQGLISNLSFNGACVEDLPELPERGLEFSIYLGGSPDCCSIRGRVVYVIEELGKERIGVEFIGSWEEKLRKLMPFFSDYIDDVPEE